MIRISTSRRGTMIRARGKDAQRLFELFSQVTQEKTAARANATPTPSEPAAPADKVRAERSAL